MGRFLVLEKFPDPYLIVDEETGKAKEFDSMKEARIEASGCHDGQIIVLDNNRIPNLNRKKKGAV